MTIPTYQATGTFISSAGTLTPSWPAHAVNDIGLLCLVSQYDQAITLSTANGFVEVTGSPVYTSSLATTRLAVFWARANSASMSSPVVADPGVYIKGGIVTFRNCVLTGNPWNVTPGYETQTASATHTFGGITTTKQNSLIVLVDSIGNVLAASMSGWTNANLTGVTEAADFGDGTGANAGIAVAYGLAVSAGAIGNSTATCSASRTSSHMVIPLVGQDESGVSAVFLSDYGVM